MSTEQFPVTKTDEEWRRLLTPEQYAVLRRHGTESPGSCALLTEHRAHFIQFLPFLLLFFRFVFLRRWQRDGDEGSGRGRRGREGGEEGRR